MERVAKSTLTLKWALAILSLLILVVIFVTWMLQPSLLSDTTTMGTGTFNLYLIMGTWAIVHASYNAIEHGIVALPRLMEPTINQHLTAAQIAEDRFGWFSLLSLVVIPIVSVPVLLSLHMELSSTQPLVSMLHNSAMLTMVH